MIIEDACEEIALSGGELLSDRSLIYEDTSSDSEPEPEVLDERPADAGADDLAAFVIDRKAASGSRVWGKGACARTVPRRVSTARDDLVKEITIALPHCTRASLLAQVNPPASHTPRAPRPLSSWPLAHICAWEHGPPR